MTSATAGSGTARTHDRQRAEAAGSALDAAGSPQRCGGWPDDVGRRGARRWAGQEAQSGPPLTPSGIPGGTGDGRSCAFLPAARLGVRAAGDKGTGRSASACRPSRPLAPHEVSPAPPGDDGRPDRSVVPPSYRRPVRASTDVRPTRGRFRVVSEFEPSGDQPAAIKALAERVNAGETDTVLLGATGTGKSATTAWLIEQVQRPTLVMAPNKTLAAQLANEFRELMPDAAVEYFVSYYDYYQPEAYVPQTDTYIEKDSSINEEVERLRHSATNSLLTRRDVVVVSTVSCIYGLGTPEEYVDRALKIKVGEE